MTRWKAPDGAQRRSRNMASAILWALHIGGPINSPGGQATKLLERRMRALGLWAGGNGRNFLFIATKLATDEWGNAITREVTPSRRTVGLALNIAAEDLPEPPAGWSAKEAVEKMAMISEAEVDRPARRDPRITHEGRWNWPPNMRDASREMVRAILWTLHDVGGVVTSKEGHAVKVLFGHVAKRTAEQPDDTARYLLGRLCGDSDGVGYFGQRAIARSGERRQCYRIELLLQDDEMPHRPEGMEPPAKPVARKTRALANQAQPAPPPPESSLALASTNGHAPEPQAMELAPTVEGSLDPIDLIISAQRLMTEAILQIAAQPPTSTPDPLVDDTVLRRLNETLEENQRLRRRIAETALAKDAKQKEVDTMRRVLAEAQANLDAVRGRTVSKRAEVDRLMRQTPGGKT